MCLFKQAAKAWLDLIGTEYEIVTGRRGKQYTIKLDFEAADFPHLAGMQYARDADFNLNPDEYYGEKLIPALIDGKLDGTGIERSRNWPRIEGRLKAIINLQKTLDSKFAIALFDQENVKYTNSSIDADYVIKNLDSGETYFVFIDEDKNQRQYCKSAFKQEKIDFMDGQQKLTLLKNTKRVDGVDNVLFLHPNFKPTETKAQATV